jgi:hypothetical protein
MSATDPFEAHEAFERADKDGFAVTEADFDATVHVDSGERRIVVDLPTLDAVVEGETIGDALVAGWFDTLERRLEHPGGVTRGPEPELASVERVGGEVTVWMRQSGGLAPAADALAVVNFVEGTWFEGIVPGYDYREDVAAMRNRAHEEGGGEPTPL